MRIYEQELFIIRLTLQLHEGTENKEEEAKLKVEKDELEIELKDIEHMITKFTELYNLKDQDLKEFQSQFYQEKDMR